MVDTATITQTWKVIYPEIMKSAGSIHIPMSQGLFRPEIHTEPPTPSRLSEADLVSICLLHRWFAVGVKYQDIKGAIVFAEPPEPAFSFAVLGTDQCSLYFDTQELSQENLLYLFPEGPKQKRYEIGKDRLIQKYLEIYEFKVRCRVAPQVDVVGNVRSLKHTIALGPFYSGLGVMSVVDTVTAPRISRGWGREADYHEPSKHYMGYTELNAGLISMHVQQRLKELD